MLAEVKKKGRVQLTVKAGAQPQESPVPPPREKPAGERGGGGAQAAAEAAPRPPPGPTKAHEFVVWADMGRYTALGIDVSWEDGRTLFVNEVKGGAVQEWNSGHLPHQQVAAGDRVVAVNGYSGDGERMAELCRELADAQGRVLLHVRGPPPPPPPESKRPAGKSAPSAEEEQKKEKREKKDKKAKEDKEEKGTNDKSDEGKKDKDDTKEDKKHKKERKEKKDK
ncbi:unnamed protein product [Prorocentrum cordatum]|uniref:PDZ domain-containing protein n=1 Tax=Prorocentrum cordatum TaxID=2364126 RepID=A0ABN9T976_9DINO|nr:unnamed protein product [Polarella glacialis]